MENTNKINSLLWKVSRCDSPGPSFIFGTHHISSLGICRQIQGFEAAFASVREVYSEVLGSEMENADIAEYMRNSMRLPEGYTLDELYSPAEQEEINRMLRRCMHSDIAFMRNMKPSVLLARLNLAQAENEIAGMGEDPDSRLDMILQEKAVEQGKILRGLETVDMQIDYLYNAPLDEQTAELLDYVSLGDDTGEYLNEITRMYFSQDIWGIHDLMMDSGRSGNSERQLERLVFSRNRRWADILADSFASTTAFVLVGAGHLPGEGGLLDLMARKGYTVEAVS